MKHSLLFAVLPLILLSSCTFNDEKFLGDEKFMTKKVETLIAQINEKKVDEIYDTFSKNKQNETPTLRDEIVSLCDSYQGGTFKKWIYHGGGSSGAHYDHGKRKLRIYDKYQVECEYKSYTFAIRWIRYDDWDKDNIGLTTIAVSEYTEGVMWPDPETQVTVGIDNTEK